VTAVLPWDLDPTLAAFPRTPADGQLLVLETRAKVLAAIQGHVIGKAVYLGMFRRPS